MTPLTRADIVEMLGPIDDFAVAEIIGMGATADELAEAQAWVGSYEPLMRGGKPMAGSRVARLVAILDTLEADEIGPAGHRI